MRSLLFLVLVAATQLSRTALDQPAKLAAIALVAAISVVMFVATYEAGKRVWPLSFFAMAAGVWTVAEFRPELSHTIRLAVALAFIAFGVTAIAPQIAEFVKVLLETRARAKSLVAAKRRQLARAKTESPN